jgi:PTH1 family peptidyl-tRNA hydrolase
MNVSGKLCHLLVPTTYMNLSGDAVSAVANFYEIGPENILVAHDELDLAAGCVRLKFSGGHAGHNGLRDIFPKINSPAFYRLRIGIGRPTQGSVADYVLHKPNHDEQTLIDSSITSALNVVPQLLAGQFEAAMKILHTVNEK